MIESFNDKQTQILFQGFQCPAFSAELGRQAYRKLKLLHNATSLNDLRVPPSNRLEQLKEDRKGQFSIRINSQWRICFTWFENNAYDVEIVDYH